MWFSFFKKRIKKIFLLFFFFFFAHLIFRNVGGNIRDGITGFSGSVMSKPKEIAHLIKNRFSSMDNINQISGKYRLKRRCIEAVLYNPSLILIRI